MKDIYEIHYNSPLGVIKITGSKDKILSLDFVEDKDYINEDAPNIHQEAYQQLDEYFKGIRKNFDLDLFFNGTEFQNKVWNELCNIPYGETATYKDMAIRIGNEKACRAVGNANNKNNIGIIIPCHRVIGSNGKLVGYAGELWRKEWLLEHEKRHR
ncbi:MAG TPA: methylated-DNA--[protein]-cysteine S-methyltransferase [Peptostreptococcaceae bacterium]|nr:methylated-DNA--[protein]-cysteine S-methyltransferase [Peptostreptococcaceae bacterium]